MKPVTKDEFYRVMNPLDVHPSIRRTPWPYTCDWKMQRSGHVVGKSVDRINGGRIETDYYLAT